MENRLRAGKWIGRILFYFPFATFARGCIYMRLLGKFEASK